MSRVAELVEGTGSQQREAAALIESAVGTMSSSTNGVAVEWASLGATIALGVGDWERAGRLAALVLKQDPANEQGAFVTRILERRQQLTPAANRPAGP